MSLLNPKPGKVDIIIATWHNLPYLKICVESIRVCTDYAYGYNIIVVNSGTKDDPHNTAQWLGQQNDIIYHNSPERLHFSAANNIGIKIGKEPYVALLNDDTIVSYDWLSALMREAVKPNTGAVNGFSNCDQGWLHNEQIMVGGVSLVPGMRAEQVSHIIPQIYAYQHNKVIIEREWVAFFATVLPREALEKVGLLDEKFKSGCEDVDLCKRLKQAGYRMVQAYDSWIFHFGGKTRKTAEDRNQQLNQEEDKYNQAYLQEKYGPQPVAKVSPPPPPPPPPSPSPRIELKPIFLKPVTPDQKVFVLFTGQAWEKWSPRNIDEGGIGGSETCAVYLAREFARKGHRSMVFSDCAGMEGTYDGVEYIPWQIFEPFMRNSHIDILVVSRRTDVFDLPYINADHKFCVVHDIWLSTTQYLKHDRVDKFIVLSPWHRDFFLNHHNNVPKEKVVVIPDGFDLERYGTTTA